MRPKNGNEEGMWMLQRPGGLRSAETRLLGRRPPWREPVRRPCGEVSKRLFGRRSRFRGVDDYLLIGLGVGGERVPVECDLADDRMVVRPGSSPLQRDVGAGPPLPELRVLDREVADEFREARIVRLARRLHADIRND